MEEYEPRPADAISATNHALVNLVRERLPQRFYRGERNWSLVSAGLILRMAGTVENVTRLLPSPDPLDALVLVRTLYEHVVTFCWISIDPRERLDWWIEDAQVSRLRMHNDLEQHFHLSPPILTPEEVKMAKRSRELPPLGQRALEVDQYWGERLPGDFRSDRDPPRDILSIRGLYVAIYRVASRATHAQPASIDPYTVEALQTYPLTIDMPSERDAADGRFWCEIAGPLFGMALVAHHAQFHRPDADRIREIVKASHQRND